MTSGNGGRVSSRKGRPNYGQEFKRQLAAAACVPNISVAKLAREHGINANLLFRWRRRYRAGELGGIDPEKAVLLPVVDPRSRRSRAGRGNTDATPSA